MKLIKEKALGLVGISFGGVLLFIVIGYSLVARSELAITLLVTLVVVVVLNLVLFRNLRLHLDIIERQLTALQSSIVLSRVPLNRPASFLRHAAAPDFIEIISEIIRRRSISKVLELGCGTSSLYITSILKQTKNASLLCLEDNLAWVRLVQSELDSLLKEDDEGNSANATSANVLHLPLVAMHPGQLPFYDIGAVDIDKYGPFDLLVVDGPSEVRLREQVFPLLKGLLVPSAIVILDDGDLSEIRKAVTNWLEQEKTWQARYYRTIKGTWIMWNSEMNPSLLLPFP
ncbi:MAG: class I SAM-dependent methyltransferase [Chloroflexi bacterium]|nr:class I SAM-dependent methyltransferase [Chloroflexota bacterium]